MVASTQRSKVVHTGRSLINLLLLMEIGPLENIRQHWKKQTEDSVMIIGHIVISGSLCSEVCRAVFRFTR